MARVRKKPLKSSYKKRRVGKVRVYKAHIKLAGLQPGTNHKYKCGIARFFNWIKVSELPFPSSLEDLDQIAGESVNYLIQDDLPLGWGSDFVCGFKRFYPRCRFSLQITSSYLWNWSKSVKRTQALLLTSDILVSLVTRSPAREDFSGICSFIRIRWFTAHWRYGNFKTLSLPVFGRRNSVTH